MPRHLRSSALTIFGFGLLLHTASVRADVFSWTNITYAPTPTVAQQSTNLGGGGGTNTVSLQFVLNGGATFLPVATVQSPAVDSYNTNNTYYASGGNAGTNRYLQIGADMVNSTNGIGSITVNIFFAKPVTNATFSFFDVDINAANAATTAAYADQIRSIQGTGTDNTAVYANSLTGTAGGNTVSGSGSTYAVTAAANNVNNLGAANATATFGSTPIKEISFVYGDAYTGTGTHGAAQIVAISDFNFVTVPEPGTIALVGLGLAGVAGVALRRR